MTGRTGESLPSEYEGPLVEYTVTTKWAKCTLRHIFTLEDIAMTSGTRLAQAWVALLIVVLFAGVFAGCSQVPMNVTSYWGPGVRFTDVPPTYEWSPASRQTTGPGRPLDPAVDPMIRRQIEKNLAEKGFTKTSGPNPGFWVDYRVARDVRGDPYGGPDFPEFVEGSLAVFLVNPTDQKLIWRGCVQGRLNESNPPDVKEQRLDQAIKKLFGQIPSR